MPTLDWSQCPAVESVPGRLSGAWVFRNTRMPVSAVFENLEAGATIDEIVEQFDISREQINEVLEFAARGLDAPAGQVLLVAHVFIGGNKDIETGRLGRGEQVAIAESIPTTTFGFRDRVTDKRACDALRRHMVKENEHRGRSQPSLERRGCGRQTQVPR